MLQNGHEIQGKFSSYSINNEKHHSDLNQMEKLEKSTLQFELRVYLQGNNVVWQHQKKMKIKPKKKKSEPYNSEFLNFSLIDFSLTVVPKLGPPFR